MMDLGRSRPDRAEMETFGRISAELLHDLAGVLAILSGRVAVAREEASLGRTPSHELARIQRDTEELRRMVTEILEELRGLPRSPEITFPLRRTLEETVDRWFGSAPSLTTTFRASLEADAEVAGPRSFFARALWNLLRNAGRHAHSQIRLTLRPAEDGTRAEFLVEDDGDDVADAIRDELFRPFATSAEGGMGLGLSFSRWAVEKLGGTLDYTGHSADLGGARFRATLPLVHRRTPPTIRKRWGPGVEKGEKRTALADLRLVLVEDEPALRSVLARLLRRAGASVDEVAADEIPVPSGVVEALAASDPDVILLDLNLGGFSGLEVLALLRRARPDLHDRVLLLTGGSPPEPEPERPVVHKLVEWPELFARIHEVAARPEGQVHP